MSDDICVREYAPCNCTYYGCRDDKEYQAWVDKEMKRQKLERKRPKLRLIIGGKP